MLQDFLRWLGDPQIYHFLGVDKGLVGFNIALSSLKWSTNREGGSGDGGNWRSNRSAASIHPADFCTVHLY
jgi:hypothetical protein